MMLPGMGKINPAQMQAMMKQFGIKSEPLNAKRVIFELENKKLVIDNPNVTAVDMQGQKTYQVVGEEHEREIDTTPEINEDDIKTVMEQAKVDEEKAKEALEKAKGDIAQAIMDLQGNSE